MTTKERLIFEVQQLSESQAAAVLEFLQSQGMVESPESPRWPPRFSSIARSGRSDLGARSEEILRAEFGSS